jgi:hypothetical protein
VFTIKISHRQLYELYYEGPGPTIKLIEALLAELADWEKILGHRLPSFND